MSLNDTHTADNYGRLILHKVNTSWIPPIKTKTLHRMFTYTDPPPPPLERLNLLYQRSHWGRVVEFVIPTISSRSCGWICYTNDLIEVYCWLCYTNDLIEVVRLNLLYQRSHWGRAVEFVIPTISLRSCGWMCYTNDLIEFVPSSCCTREIA